MTFSLLVVYLFSTLFLTRVLLEAGKGEQLGNNNTHTGSSSLSLFDFFCVLFLLLLLGVFYFRSGSIHGKYHFVWAAVGKDMR